VEYTTVYYKFCAKFASETNFDIGKHLANIQTQRRACLLSCLALKRWKKTRQRSYV